MSTHLAEAERVDCVAIAVPLPADVPQLEDDERTSPARGIILAVIILCPIWALVGFTIYRLL
jgi:hypothetical protein